MNRSPRQKISREIKEITDVKTRMSLTDIYRTFHPNTKEYTFFSEPHGTFSKICHILSHKSNANRYNKMEISLRILSGHIDLRLKYNSTQIAEFLETHGN